MSTPSENESQRSGEEPETDAKHGEQKQGADTPRPKVVVSSAAGLGIAADDEGSDPSAMVEEPAKVMRIGTMIKQLLDEVRSAPLDDAARERLAEIHERSLHELEDGLNEDLIDELHRITLPFTDDRSPSDAELRIAQAQLVGWLEGLFHGIQTALVAQQMAAQNQLVQMRRALPPGAAPQQAMPPMGMPGQQGERGDHGTGQYL
ncbi:bacterial proteasome activator family protein [Ruania albidiflava]|uniref:bacterial proteasome activator family protein n=1 Tax=Ruania albidiflava TaxID=366586 RepID=UPI0003B44200|nr:bacterial proteasome activator family protein [Ruania albidiflava]